MKTNGKDKVIIDDGKTAEKVESSKLNKYLELIGVITTQGSLSCITHHGSLQPGLEGF